MSGYGFSEADYSQELRDALIDVGSVGTSDSRFRMVVANALCSAARSLERLAAAAEEGQR